MQPDHLFSTYAKFSAKQKILNMRIKSVIINISFSENFVYKLNAWLIWSNQSLT